MRRNYWLSLSFANFVYLRAWSDLLPVSSEDFVYRKTLPGINLYFAVAGDVLLLSLLAFLVISLASKLPGWFRKILQKLLLVAAVAMVALALHSVAPRGFLRSGLFGYPLLGLICAVLTGMAFAFPSRILRLVQAVALATTPCLAVTFVGSTFYLLFQPSLPPDPPLAQRLAGSPPVRVLWIVFDEWDQQLTFPDRAPGVVLPVIDILANQSFTATRALAVEAGIVPVSQMATAYALPSLLYGKHAVASAFEKTGSETILFDDGASTMLGAGDNIFARVRAHGWNAAVAGWYLPYCRDFGARLTDCYWDVKYDQRTSAGPSLFKAAGNETRMLFETTMFSAFGPSLALVRHAAEYDALLASAQRYAADPSIGLAFIHFNIPHTPYFYNPKVGRFGHYGYSDALYNDALQGVDRSVGAILASIRKAGLDSKTAIVLSSDHPLRSSKQDPRVPFIVHLPGETAGMVSDKEFSAIETPELVLAIARGEVKSPLDVENFVQSHAGADKKLLTDSQIPF